MICKKISDTKYVVHYNKEYQVEIKPDILYIYDPDFLDPYEVRNAVINNEQDVIKMIKEVIK